MPSFKNVDKALSKVRVPALVLVLALVVPAFLGQAHTVFTYQNSEPDPNLRAGADTLMIQDEFGQQNAVVVLVPNIDLLSVMLTAQFVNGIILPVLLVFMAIISADKRVMGAYRSRFVSRALIWLTVAIVTVLTVALLVMQVMGIE